MGNIVPKLSWNDRLIDAVVKCNPNSVKECLERIADVNASTANGETVLNIASGTKGTDGTEIVRLLLRYGANPNMVSHVVSSELVEKLKDCSKQERIDTLNGITVQYVTPLLTAVKCGNIDTIQLLISGGADPNYCHPKWEYGIVTHVKFVAVLQILLTAGLKVDTNSVIKYSEEVPRDAFTKDTLKLLLKTVLHQDIINKNKVNGDILVHHALNNDDTYLVTMLIENNAVPVFV